jgi:hypothetical protein
MVRRFIADNSNASEAVRGLIADYMAGRLMYADDVLRVVENVLKNATISTTPARPATSGEGGQVNPNDQYVQQIAGALGRKR